MTSGIFKKAVQVAEKSDFDQFKVGAVIFRGSKILSAESNAIRSCSKLNKKFQKWENSLHAEQHSIIKARRDLKGASMLVVRVNKNGGIGMARPCDMCWGFMEAVGIKEVYYTTSTGEIARERISMN